MAIVSARYDEFAEWYEQWIGEAPLVIAAHADLLPGSSPRSSTRAFPAAGPAREQLAAG
jgi:hypothetical protein